MSGNCPAGLGTSKNCPAGLENVQKLPRRVRKRPETAPQGQKRQETAPQGQAVKLEQLGGRQRVRFAFIIEPEKKIGKKKNSKNFLSPKKNFLYQKKIFFCSKSSKTSKKIDFRVGSKIEEGRGVWPVWRRGQNIRELFLWIVF